MVALEQQQQPAGGLPQVAVNGAADQQQANGGAPPARGSYNRRPDSPSLADYRRVPKPQEPTPDDEIRVTGTGKVSKYVGYAAKLFIEQQKEGFTIRATGKAVSIAVNVCEVVKRRFVGLHQQTAICCKEIIDEYEPIKEGLEHRTEKRIVPCITILLTRNESAVDKSAIGYQPPLDPSEVKELEYEEVVNPSRGRRRNLNNRRGGANGNYRSDDVNNNNTGGETGGEDNINNNGGSNKRVDRYDGSVPRRGGGIRGRGGRGRRGRGRGRRGGDGPQGDGKQSQQPDQQQNLGQTNVGQQNLGQQQLGGGAEAGNVVA